MRRVRVLARWAMISLVGVAIAAFIVFDVLDLDGSNLSRPTNGSTLTADHPVSETERLLSRTASPSSAPGTAPAVTRPSRPMHPGVARLDIEPPVPRTQWMIVHLHVWKDDTLHGADFTANDPA